MTRVGLVGGSFNPPHKGHLHLSKLAYQKGRFNKIWWLVTPQNPFKSSANTSPLQQRVSWCRKITKNKPWIKVTDLEKHFHTYETFNTLRQLRRRFSHKGYNFTWIMGLDNVDHFHRWRLIDEILQSHDIFIFSRLNLFKKQRMLRSRFIQSNKGRIIHNTKLISGHKKHIYLFHTTRNKTSSSDLRKTVDF